MKPLWLALLPELREFPEPERDEALRTARQTPLEVIELSFMALAIAAITALTRYSLPDAAIETRVAATLLNFAVALPLLAVALTPLHVRRLRRGLRHQLESRGRP